MSNCEILISMLILHWKIFANTPGVESESPSRTTGVGRTLECGTYLVVQLTDFISWHK